MKTKNNNILYGIAAAPGIAIAEAYLFSKEKEEISESPISNVEEAIGNLDEAIAKSKRELTKVFSLAIDKLGEKRAAIFEAQVMILDDPVLLENIARRIKDEKRMPEFIVHDEISKYQKLMNSSNEPYMKERSQDIEDIKNRIIRNLKKKKWKSRITSDVIVVSETLTPSDTVLFARVNVKGYVTEVGGLTSHAAIVARSLDIPAVVGVHDSTNKILNSDVIIIDGFHGLVIIDPDQEQLDNYKLKIERLAQYDKKLAALKDIPAVTTDGKKIKIMANLDVTDEIEMLIQNGAEGIGLVRTEQLFQENDQFPEEEIQYDFYKKLAEKLYPRRIIIRAFDFGGDKVLPFDVKEPNPFLGWRGIRFLSDNKELFKSQIRAVLRANVHKNISFMIPMISNLCEIDISKKIVNECVEELRNEGIEHDENIKLGIMIEVPSAAILIEQFSKNIDFISIGTNDLIQYMLAVDRGNEIVSDLYREFHPAIIKTLKFIIDNASCNQECISMCGEMAADLNAIPLLVGLGYESLSVSASAIPYLKKIIRNINFNEVKELADECLTMNSADQIFQRLKQFQKEKLTDQIENII